MLKTSIKVINKGDRRGEVLIYDVIGEDFFGDGVTAKKFRADLDSLGEVDVIDVRINSPGGSVFDGIPIYNALLNHKATVNVWIDGAAWSMASGIAMAGDTVNMAENALFMMHDPSTFSFGSSDDLRKEADRLDKVKDQLAVAYERKSGLSKDEITDLMSAETWLDANEAKDKGFVDNVTSPVESENTFETPEFIRIPGNHFSAAMNLLRPKNSPERKGENMAEKSEPKKETIDPAAVDNAITVGAVDEPATIEQLSALEGADSDFVVTHLKNKSTVSQAMNALNKKLRDEIASLRKDENKPESDEDADEARKSSKPPVGNASPLKTENPNVPKPETTGYESMNAKEKQAELRRLVEEKRSSLGDRFNHITVMNRLQATHPDLFSESHLKNAS